MKFVIYLKEKLCLICIVFLFLIFFFQCDIFEIVLELRKQRYGMIQVKVSLTPILLMYMYIWKKMVDVYYQYMLYLLSLNELSQLSQIMNIWLEFTYWCIM